MSNKYIHSALRFRNPAMNIVGGHEISIRAKKFSDVSVGDKLFIWDTVHNMQDDVVPYVVVKFISVLENGDIYIEYANKGRHIYGGNITVKQNVSYKFYPATGAVYATCSNAIKLFYCNKYISERSAELKRIIHSEERIRQLNKSIVESCRKEFKLINK